LRIASVLTGIILVASGLVGELYYGGIDTLGIGEFWATCPLGYLERSLAARRWLPQWPSVLLVVFAIFLLGRVFCAWICPTVLLRRIGIFKWKKRSMRDLPPAPRKGGLEAYSPYAVLGGVLLASYVFRFPIFCLFCPVGLFFGLTFAVIRLFSVNTFGLELLLFPLMLVLEIWVLKSWCRTICPLGALFSIFGRLNRFIIPTVKEDKCLSTSRGLNCQVCERVCPEGISMSNSNRRLSQNSCTKCLECYDHCPAKAIKLAIFK
jgi:ferredoxin-type protein NapH